MSLPVFPYGKLSFAVSLVLCSAYSFAAEVENTQPQERVDLPTVTVQGVGKRCCDGMSSGGVCTGRRNEYICSVPL